MALIDEIRAKCTPEQIAARNDVAIAELVNAGRTATAPVPRSLFAMWLGATGLRATIQDISTTVGHPLRASALTILDFLLGGVASGFDTQAAENIAMLGAWQSAGAVTGDQIAQLNAMAIVAAPVSVDAISDALNMAGL